MPTTTADIDWLCLGAVDIAQQLTAGEFDSSELTRQCIARISEAASVNAMTVKPFAQAAVDAARADQMLEACRSSKTIPPKLCGIPITVKDCFDLTGTPATLGIERKASELATKDGALVQRLRTAGAVLLGKTNVPQAMLLHCCDNPLWGRTLHPSDPSRGPGGSSGGEAAIIASGGSIMGLASDLGGSIRQPAHVCGLVGFKPTTGRLTSVGSHHGLQGMEAIKMDPGPIAKRVVDADLMMQVLVGSDCTPRERDEIYGPWRDYRTVDVSRLTIATATTDNWFAPAPPCERAVREAHTVLGSTGASVSRVSLRETDRAMRLYFGLVSADGFRSVRRMLRGSPVDWQIRRQSWFARLSLLPRLMLRIGLRLFGQHWLATLLDVSGPRSAAAYWQLTNDAKHFASEFWQHLDRQVGRRVDVLVLPPHALPALRHGTALDLLPAASYCYLANLLGAPAGVVPWTTVQDDEQIFPHGKKVDLVAYLARHTMHESAGLPIGVQVIARPWEDDVTLAVMAALEERARAASLVP